LNNILFAISKWFQITSSCNRDKESKFSLTIIVLSLLTKLIGTLFLTTPQINILIFFIRANNKRELYKIIYSNKSNLYIINNKQNTLKKNKK